MNKFMLFGAGVVLLTLMLGFTSANLGQWLKEKFVASEDPQLGPGPSEALCSSSTSTRTGTLEACKWVKSPLGQFTKLDVQTLKISNVLANHFFGTINDQRTFGYPALWLFREGAQENQGILGAGVLVGEEAVVTEVATAESIIIGRAGISEDARIEFNGEYGLLIDPLTSPAQVAIEGDFRLTGVSKIDSLAGEGNAYVCVTPDGTLYRSLTPCR